MLITGTNKFGYQTVLDDFANADKVSVVTYSIAPDHSGLLEILKSVQCEARLITNVPKHFSTYFSGYARKKAQRQIREYCSALSPADFGEEFETYFNTKNHAKIILTNNVAYVGSQNFTDVSQDNFEAGILTQDEGEIRQLEEYIDTIVEESYHYVDDDELAILKVDGLMLCREVKEFGRLIFTEEKYGSIEDFANLVYSLKELFEEGDGAANSSGGHFQRVFGDGPVQAVADMVQCLEENDENVRDWSRSGAESAAGRAGDITAEEMEVTQDGRIDENHLNAMIQERDYQFEVLNDSTGQVLKEKWDLLRESLDELEPRLRSEF